MTDQQPQPWDRSAATQLVQGATDRAARWHTEGWRPLTGETREWKNQVREASGDQDMGYLGQVCRWPA